MTSPHRCGPGWMPEALRRVLSVRFNPACAQHDRDYQSGEGGRAEADARFLDHMLELADGSWWWRFLAHAYYRAARLFGASRWRGA